MTPRPARALESETDPNINLQFWNLEGPWDTPNTKEFQRKEVKALAAFINNFVEVLQTFASSTPVVFRRRSIVKADSQGFAVFRQGSGVRGLDTRAMQHWIR